MNLATVKTVDKSDALQFALGQSHLGKRSIFLSISEQKLVRELINCGTFPKISEE